VTRCPACGSENAADARFCSACGAALAPVEPEAPEVRKTVTVLFADVTGSTALGEQLDPEAARKLMASYFEVARTILERHGGTVEKFIGDAVMAVFGVPQLHEDDALRAVRAAAELRDGVTEVQLRIGVNTGEVVAGGGETLVTGDPVNTAARLQQAAQPGEVLVGERTLALVRDAVEVEAVDAVDAKGKAEPVPACRLLRVLEGADPFLRRLDTPLVGREREQRLLREAFERAIADRSCHLFTLLGTAGIGKSRLAQELVANVGADARVVTGRCLPYGDGITYWPLVEILHELGSASEVVQYLEAEPDARLVVNHVFAAVGLAEEELSPEEAFWAVRKLFEALAREQPLVVVLDDLHWAEPTFLDLVEHLADWSREAPILLLCLARPELLDVRVGWGGGKLNATSLFLEPLSEDDTEKLIDNLFARLADATRTRITAAAEGNPLFVEQMLAMLTEQAGLDAELEVPPTIQALLAARIDLLPPAERTALERAAVIGKEFSRAAIEELGGDPAALPALVRKELIRPERSAISGDDGFRFRHLLVRDAAYETIPKELRADLHEQFASWTETQRSEYDEIVGYHLEQAYRYREQLGTIDEDLAHRAAARLAAAGRRADSRGDAHAVANLLGRAVALMPQDSVERLELLPILSSAKYQSGEIDEAGEILQEAVAAARNAGERALEIRASLQLQAQRFWQEPEGGTKRLRQAAETAIPELERLGDDRGLADAWDLVTLGHLEEGNAAAANAANEHVLLHARKAGDRRREQAALVFDAQTISLGTTPVEAAISHVERRLSEAASASNQLGEGRLWIVLGDLRSQLGDHDEGRRLATDGLARLKELGHHTIAAGLTMLTADIDLRAGDAASVEAQLRPAYKALDALGDKGAGCGVAARLAAALYQQDRLDEAELFTRASEEAAASSDVIAQIWWREVRAKVLARRGDESTALRLAREAVELSEPSDHLVMKGQAHEALGETLRLLGDADEARKAYERAVELYEEKGDVADAGRVLKQLEALTEGRKPAARG
jgi:class 3 adenylate cyclase/tetratricopeptide (TPR) repeat protein